MNHVGTIASLRRAASPFVLIGGIWISTLKELGHELPYGIGLLVGLVLLGLFFWGAPPEVYWRVRASADVPKRREREPWWSEAWWATVRRNRFLVLALIAMAGWAVAFVNLLGRGIGDEAYLVGLAVSATIVIIVLIWTDLRLLRQTRSETVNR